MFSLCVPSSGYITTCPGNLGTGLRCGAMVKLPLFAARKDFKDILAKMHLRTRKIEEGDYIGGAEGESKEGVWEILNVDRLGWSEVQVCNLFCAGVAQIIKWQKALEIGGIDIEKEVENAHPLGII